jgi:hypothetical protein
MAAPARKFRGRITRSAKRQIGKVEALGPTMRRRYAGYIFQFTWEVGVYDRLEGPIRGPEREWNRHLQDGLQQFIRDLNERGYFT